MIFPAVSVSLPSPVREAIIIVWIVRIFTPTTGAWDGFETQVIEEEGEDEEFTDEEEGKAKVHVKKVSLHLKRYGIPDLRLFTPPPLSIPSTTCFRTESTRSGREGKGHQSQELGGPPHVQDLRG